MQRTLKSRELVAALVIVLAGLGSAQAQSKRDCGGQDKRLWVAACTIIIDDPKTNPKARIKALKFRGAAHHFQGELDAAITDFSAVLAIDPNDYEALSDRGLAYQAKGQSDLVDDDKAIAVNPKFAFAYFNRGIVEESKGDLAKARHDYDEAIRLKPEFPGFYKKRAQLRLREGDADGAVADANAGITITDSDPDLFIVRANAYRRQRALDKARADYESALRLEPNASAPYVAAATSAPCRATSMARLPITTRRSSSIRRMPAPISTVPQRNQRKATTPVRP